MRRGIRPPAERLRLLWSGMTPWERRIFTLWMVVVDSEIRTEYLSSLLSRGRRYRN